jgi:anti-sigma B factor antagonist
MAENGSARGLTLVVVQSSGTPVVRCSGRLVAGVTDRFYREVSAIIPGSKRVVLDFTDITHMDSMGIGTLVRLYVSGKSTGCTIELLNPGKSIRQLLGITHLLDVLAIVGENNIRMG